jgi:putative ABC transport system substrate-binding protein
MAAVLCLLTSGVAAAQGSGRMKILVVKTRDIPFYQPAVEGFEHGLKSQGYDNGNVDISVTSLTGDVKKDTDLVHGQMRGCKLIYAVGTDAARAVADEQPAVPVLFSMVVDPVRIHLVKSLDQPGGEFSGSTLLVNGGKQLDALLQVAPGVHKIGVLYTDGDPTSVAFLDDAKQDATRLGVQIVATPMAPGAAAKGPLEQLASQVDAFWLILDPASASPQATADTLACASAHHKPVLGVSSASVHAGALLALSADIADLGEVTAQMAIPLLQGTATPATMRVRGPRQTKLSINLVAAGALNLNVPDSVLHLADEVIDK